ncbi:primosomal protein N' [Caproiciproducens galactitolivorans]|uniref:Replication restart protein PriA n=1 Tax=Caproiciproducens galactitolivorans TaxID=642589 RepID=A0A4Z0Y154_9FIRM|nr:primosomal protein N' [Caproiciproducens galactitolivorans]QEY34032.1 primosomal protein N' [Caproiciproducens galactitolivorans]TGJ76557.1 primosomal protein N' [Caproiciproducens galactitolivorans]
MSEFTVAKVAVEKTVYHFDKAFDYCVPETLLADAKPGCRVIVPFGGANSKRQGIILAITEQKVADCLKPILAVLDKAPLLSNEGLQLVSWMKEHYFCTLFDAVKLLLPAGLNLKIRTEYSLAVNSDTLFMEDFSESEKQVIRYLAHARTSVDRDKLLSAMGFSDDSVLQKLCSANVLVKSSGAVRRIGDAAQKMVRLTDLSYLPKLTKKQKNVYDLLCEAGSASLKELCYFAGVTPVVVNTLATKGIVQYFEMEVYRNPYEHISGNGDAEDIVLSSEQQKAFENLYQQYRSGKGGVSLLYGVTGSGKTSVFMRLIDEVKGEGRGIIVMVPEISLTPQTVALFHQRYGRSVAVFHSGLSLGERLDEWKRVKNGEAQIAVGTRSAVFAPFQDLGIIIVDEEQEYTYKSESSPRYHAREVAKFRCAYHKALLVLSSATPSIESYYLAQNGRYSLNTLSTRFGCAELPEVTVVDMNRELENGNDTILSAELFSALNDNLKNGKQSILLLNRRGFHTFVSCKKCGQVVTCPHCSISLTYHSANKRLMCHYCGYSIPFTKECPQCHENQVYYTGWGTQRAEQQLQELLPDARILRLDTDSTMTRFAYERKLRLFAQGEYDIIVGTQMVAKGLDFENVTLVGVLSADQTLYSDDFRSYERAFDLITQVVGRSGRGKFAGRAIIQTFTPENSILRLAARQDYQEFYKGEIAIRKAMLYPPYSDICVIGFVGNMQDQVHKASKTFLSNLAFLAKSEYPEQPLRVLNPAPALIGKVNNKYRYKLIIKCRNNAKLREMISRLLIQFSENREYKSVTVFADMNPNSIL